MKKIILLILICFGLLALAYQNPSVRSPRIIKVGAFNYYPAIFKDSDDKVKGFIVDILDHIAEQENWKLEFVYGSWNEGLQRIKNNEIDLLTSVAYTKERATFLDYSTSDILTVWSQVYTGEDSDLEGILSLSGKKIGIMKGDFNGATLVELLKSFNIKCDIVEYDNFETIFQLINTREIDAGVVNNIYGIGRQEEYHVKSTSIVFNAFNLYFAAPKGYNNEILTTIDGYLKDWKRKESSPYHKALHSWSYKNINVVSNIPTWLTTVLLVLGAALIISSLFIYLLRRQIRLATAKIEKSESEVRTLVQSLDDVVFTLDLNQKHTGVYGKWLNKNGLKPEHFLGKTSREILGVDNAEIHIRANERALNGEDVVYEWMVENGRVKTYTQTSLSPIRDKHSNVIGLVGVGRDITSLKQVENNLRAEKERMQMIIEGTPFLFFYTQDINGKITYISPSVEQITGYTVDEWKSSTEWFTTNNDINRIAREKTHAHLRGEIDRSVIPLEILSSDGKQVLLEIYEDPIFENGVVCGLHGVAHDVTEQKNSLNELKRNERIFRLFVQHSPASIAMFDKNMKYIVASNHFIKDYDLPFDDLTGLLHYEVFPEIPDQWKEIHRNCLNGAVEKSSEDKFVRANGDIDWVRWEIHPWHESNGDIGGIILFSEVITEQKKAADALREREELFKMIFNTSPYAIGLSEIESGKYYDVNVAFEKIIGYSKEEALGKTSLNLGVWINPNDRSRLLQLIELNGFIGELDCQFKIKSGQTIDTKVTARHLIINKKKYLLSIIEDITEKKKIAEAINQSREMLTKLAEQVPGVVYQYRLFPDGRSCFPYASPGIVDIYAVTPEEVREDATPVFGRLHPEDYDMIVSTIMESARTLEFYHSEFRVILPEQGVRWRLCNAKPERLEDGSTLWYGIISDITDRKIVEAELEKHRLHLEDLVQSRTEEIDTINKQLQESLEKEKELSSLKSRFISTASHEFRTPLTSVLTSAELIQRYYERWGQDKVNEHLNRIKNSVSNLTKLMDDVLIVNRAESGKTVLMRSNVDLRSICNNVIEEVEIHAQDHHAIVLNYGADRNYFLIDQKQIELILHNLISNAIKYSPNGGEISINVNADEKNLEFRINDPGIGIPEEDLPRLFESFHRAKNTVDIQGTGLGLSIVKHAVDLHEGTIKVESKIGIGTTFIVTIPIPE